MLDSSLVNTIYYSYLAARGLLVIASISVIIFIVSVVSAVLSLGACNKKIFCSMLKIGLPALAVVFVIVGVLGFTCETNSSNLANEIKESYNVIVDSNRLAKSIYDIEDGVSPVMHARLNDDDRVYDVYLVEDNAGDSYNLCTRSEKGVYLKITGSSKELLK